MKRRPEDHNRRIRPPYILSLRQGVDAYEGCLGRECEPGEVREIVFWAQATGLYIFVEAQQDEEEGDALDDYGRCDYLGKKARRADGV
jgi:hypothetical protein